MRSDNHEWDQRPSGPLPRRLGCRQGGLLGVVLAFACLTAIPAARAIPAPATVCSTRGLVAGNGAPAKPAVSIAQIRARGVSCAKAAADARLVAGDLAAGKAISLPGSRSLVMVTTSAGGLLHTKVSVGYPTGSVILALNGSPRIPSAGVQTPFGRIPGLTIPAVPGFSFPKIPGFPFPRIPGFPLPSTPIPSNPPTGRTTV